MEYRAAIVIKKNFLKKAKLSDRSYHYYIAVLLLLGDYDDDRLTELYIIIYNIRHE